MVEDIRGFSLEELEKKFAALGWERYRARQVFAWLYKKGVEDFSLMENIPAALRKELASYFTIGTPVLEKILTAADLTQKFLFRLKDGPLIESVTIPARSRLTACLSTQAGCKFSCGFCASGILGFKRNLAVSEIVGQLIAMRHHVPENKVSNVVFMGVGEPLDNYDNLLSAIRLFNSEEGLHMGARKMTISTVGMAEAIERLSKEGLQVELSISLHAATDRKRSEILPVNKRYPLAVLMKAVRAYYQATKRKLTFEYVLLGGFNTSVEDAQSVIRLLRGLNARVNLIPYNEVSSRFKFHAPTKPEVLFFKSYLEKHGIEATLRMPRGGDIAAACGQLRYQF